eukprot:6185648-Pleurochrysis_carterae.AAC.4
MASMIGIKVRIFNAGKTWILRDHASAEQSHLLRVYDEVFLAAHFKQFGRSSPAHTAQASHDNSVKGSKKAAHALTSTT